MLQHLLEICSLGCQAKLFIGKYLAGVIPPWNCPRWVLESTVGCWVLLTTSTAGALCWSIITLQEPAKQALQNQEGENPPFSYYLFPVPSTDKASHCAGWQRKKYLKGLSPFLPNTQWDINLQLRDGKLIPGIWGNLYLAEISEDHLVQSPIF